MINVLAYLSGTTLLNSADEATANTLTQAPGGGISAKQLTQQRNLYMNNAPIVELLPINA